MGSRNMDIKSRIKFLNKGYKVGYKAGYKDADSKLPSLVREIHDNVAVQQFNRGIDECIRIALECNYSDIDMLVDLFRDAKEI